MTASRTTTFLLVLILPRLLQLCYAGTDSSKRLHIVYMGEKQHDDPLRVTASHHDALTSVLGSKELAVDSIVYSYRHGFSGFAAMLTASQAKKIKGFPGVLHVARSREAKLQTTRSWDFLGLTQHQPTGLLQQSKFGEDMIIGVIDTGMGGLTVFSDGVQALIEKGHRKITPFFIPYAITNMGSTLFAMDIGFMGVNYSISTACATSNYCFYSAANHIRPGRRRASGRGAKVLVAEEVSKIEPKIGTDSRTMHLEVGRVGRKGEKTFFFPGTANSFCCTK